MVELKKILLTTIFSVALIVTSAVFGQVPVVSRPIVLEKSQWLTRVDLDIGMVHGRSFHDFFLASHEPMKRVSGLVVAWGFAKGFETGIGVSPYVKDRRGQRFGAVHGYVRARIMRWLAGEIGISAPSWDLFDEPHIGKLGLWFGLPLHLELSRGGFAVFFRPDLAIGLMPADAGDPSVQLRVLTDIGLGLNISPQVYLELAMGYHQTVKPVRRLQLPVSIAFSYSFKGGVDLRAAVVFWDLHPDLGLSSTHFRGLSLSLSKYW